MVMVIFLISIDNKSLEGTFQLLCYKFVSYNNYFSGCQSQRAFTPSSSHYGIMMMLLFICFRAQIFRGNKKSGYTLSNFAFMWVISMQARRGTSQRAASRQGRTWHDHYINPCPWQFWRIHTSISTSAGATTDHPSPCPFLTEAA